MEAPVNDATTALLRAVRLNVLDAGGQRLVVEEVRSRSWASATFTGARHELTLRVEGDGAGAAADRFLSNLEAAEFELRGHIMADIALVSREHRSGETEIRLEALTVEDA